MSSISRGRKRRWWLWLVFGALLIWAAPYGLSALGQFLVVEETPGKADAVIVLSTGIDIYPRWIEAARLYRSGYVKLVVVNGNRKTDVLRRLEAQGLRFPYPWDTHARAVLTFLGVPDTAIVSIAAEDAFDTISEARIVAAELPRHRIKTALITTSRFHTRRARRIWHDAAQGTLQSVTMIAAQDDPYSADRWWYEPRQIRWVMAEYGGWLMYWWRRWFG